MAKKPKGFSELLGQQRRQQVRQAIERSYDELEAYLGADAIVIREPVGVAKMSAVIEEFLAPYKNDMAPKLELERLFAFGIVAWNLAIAPLSERPAMIDKFFAEVLTQHDSDLVAEGKALMQELIDRKERYFGDNKRIIGNFKLQYFAPGDYSIAIASIIPEPND